MMTRKNKKYTMKIKMFRRVVLAVLLALVVQSCQTPDIPNVGRYPILFADSGTRAVANIETLQTEGFKVYAFFQGNKNSSTFEKSVTYNSQENVWVYNPLEYWIPSTSYWFKAFYPTTLTAGELTVDNSSSSQTFSISDFDITEQVDVMVASSGQIEVPKGADAPVNGSVVNLEFKHILASVVVKIKAEVNVTIQDISLKYVPVKCSYSNGIWSQSSQGNIEKSGVNKQLVKSNEYTEVPEGGFLVVPSSADGVELYVKTSDKQYNIKIPTINWASGVKYIYTMTIKQNDIIFNEPTVKDWDEESATGSVVIK